jgi:hypothetical protein
MRIAFLHIPKTAGQSIHHSLADLFPKPKVCPARTNEDLHKYSVSDLKQYSLFSGHLDWSLLKLTGPFDYTFTVLRDPLDRILSFYFYLRKEAERLKKAGKAIGPGMHAAITLSPEEYFTGGDPGLRSFLDNHYNNFYAYYFASGSYSGHSQLSKKFAPGSVELFQCAKLGLQSLDAVYTLSSLSKVLHDIGIIANKELHPLVEVNVNRDVLPTKRSDLLTNLAGEWNWRPVLSRLTVTDNLLFSTF